jgi:hypothetical protein
VALPAFGVIPALIDRKRFAAAVETLPVYDTWRSAVGVSERS